MPAHLFDVLLHLPENRHRVVTKHERVHRVWHGAGLAGSAGASAVMKARTPSATPPGVLSRK